MFAYSKLSLKTTKSAVQGVRTMATKENLVEFNVLGNARTITLNRPGKLNALNTEMCKEITPRLIEFSNSNAAKVILIKSNSDRAFCSGGDVVQCAKDNLAGDQTKSLKFFQNEYNLNYLLSIYGKPIVSLVNGITMGGGVGLSVHGAFRVVTETTRFAMPETSIGFFNDVGTSFWLPKLDSNLGYYLSLTGDELHGFDTLLAGYGTHYVPTNRFPDLINRLSELELKELAVDTRKNTLFNHKSNAQLFALVNTIIEEFTVEIPKNHKFKYNNEQLDVIEKCFNPDTNKSVVDVIKSLHKDGSKFALETIDKLHTKSPLSLHLNWTILQRNRKSTIQESLNRELKLAAKMMTSYRDNDFNDFIKNKLIEKNSEAITSKYAKTVDDVQASVVDDLVSLDVYNPKNTKTPEESEKLIEMLNNLKINSFNNIGERVPNFANYPHHMGLPTQSEIEAFVKGNESETASDAKVMVTFKETLEYFRSKYDGRAGVDAKVKLVLNRKSHPSSINEEFLEWRD